jgi:hypothetical protein
MMKTKVGKEETKIALTWDPLFVSECCYYGLLPMAIHIRLEVSQRFPVPLPKLHVLRSLILLRPLHCLSLSKKKKKKKDADGEGLGCETGEKEPMSETLKEAKEKTNWLHVRKSVRGRAKNFRMTINTAFDQVVKGIQAQHGTNCWLYPPLVEAYSNMLPSETGESQYRASIVSIELWDIKTNSLAAGELGYIVGSSYTSLTGFYEDKYPSSGSVQLIALGSWLHLSGFSIWLFFFFFFFF